jgi:hypothetical protein
VSLGPARPEGSSAATVRGTGLTGGPLDRHLLPAADTAARAGRLGARGAERPRRGPWRTACYPTAADPKRRGPPDGPYRSPLADSFSGDGRRPTLIFAGSGEPDAASLVDGSSELGRWPVPPAASPRETG